MNNNWDNYLITYRTPNVSLHSKEFGGNFCWEILLEIIIELIVREINSRFLSKCTDRDRNDRAAIDPPLCRMAPISRTAVVDFCSRP